MSKAKKHKPNSMPAAESSLEKTSVDPLDCLRHPAQPPRPNVTAFIITLMMFGLWFAYLVFVAWRG